jgi:glycerophosphoryl diester phosphodiesterase
MSRSPRHAYFDLEGPLILGHRGAAGDAPENTLEAFALGVEQGAHIIETDVHATRDGVVVCLHDAEVDRTTDGNGPVRNFLWHELQALDAAHRFIPGLTPEDDPPADSDAASFTRRGQGIRIPSLGEGFEKFPRTRFNIEIKAATPGLVRSVIELIQRHEREDTTLVTAAADPVMAAIRSELVRTGARPAIGASTGDVLAFVRAALEDRAPQSDSMALQIPTDFAGNPLVTPELVGFAHRHAVDIHVWTIDRPSEMHRLLDLEVDGLVTDFPGRMARVLSERCGGR